jgi:hypothetical protein
MHRPLAPAPTLSFRIHPIKIESPTSDRTFSFHPASHAFFLDAIEETDWKDLALSIYPKRFTLHRHALPVML